MTATLGWTAASVALAALAGMVVPWLGMRMLWPSLEAGARKVRNYRGAEVSHGLGLVWLLWAITIVVLMIKVVLVGATGLWSAGAALSLIEWDRWLVAGILVLAAFAFGLVDDAFGSAEARGFRGHLRAMISGRLTTGGLKLIGIGAASALAALFAVVRAPQAGSGGPAAMVAPWVLGTLAIALTANLVNLTDLRPGRALKAYTFLAMAGVTATAAAPLWYSGATSGGGPLTVFAITALLALGPVFAIWRYDLGERGMLGDAGANSMGALAGFLLASSLPLWGLAAYAAVVLALNLLSEKVSLSKVIDGNALLRWIDGLGRLKDVDTRKDGAI